MLDDIDHLLDDAITLHEERKFFLASVKYLKILEQDALHADTNHNFGLLKVELGLEEEALIFLQTAINTNPNVLQYWVTFINTLTNVERFDDAGSVLEQAHFDGLTGGDRGVHRPQPVAGATRGRQGSSQKHGGATDGQTCHFGCALDAFSTSSRGCNSAIFCNAVSAYLVPGARSFTSL